MLKWLFLKVLVVKQVSLQVSLSTKDGWQYSLNLRGGVCLLVGRGSITAAGGGGGGAGFWVAKGLTYGNGGASHGEFGLCMYGSRGLVAGTVKRGRLGLIPCRPGIKARELISLLVKLCKFEAFS